MTLKNIYVLCFRDDYSEDDIFCDMFTSLEAAQDAGEDPDVNPKDMPIILVYSYNEETGCLVWETTFYKDYEWKEGNPDG